MQRLLLISSLDRPAFERPGLFVPAIAKRLKAHDGIIALEPDLTSGLRGLNQDIDLTP